MSYLEKIIGILQNNSRIYYILEEVEKMDLPNWYLGGGCITQSIWNSLCDNNDDYGIKDYDIVYFDKDVSFEKETEYILKIREALPGIDTDVKNQARVHLWYHDVFAQKIDPYSSVEEAISSWPTTVASIGVRKVNEELIVYAPFGLEDLFSLIVRPNKIQVTQDIYITKTKRWLEKWPQLKVVSW
ncbi:nucleotidyltransferase family protein [Candidatus Uabimicrobium sp. HlEnr_7]|uniref:nucleotidyltransferase family protein n=1 Tax=Candidatus Uabimicrobium helgolandensis TaxID=3095367 RepID=UPI0035573839